MVGTQGDVTADRIQLFLKEGGKELDRAEADGTGDVKEGVRTATGQHLIYTPAERDLRHDRHAGGDRGEDAERSAASATRQR